MSERTNAELADELWGNGTHPTDDELQEAADLLRSLPEGERITVLVMGEEADCSCKAARGFHVQFDCGHYQGWGQVGALFLPLQRGERRDGSRLDDEEYSARLQHREDNDGR